MSPDPEKPKWPFDPLQPGDHEPARMPEGHPSRTQKHPDPEPE